MTPEQVLAIPCPDYSEDDERFEIGWRRCLFTVAELLRKEGEDDSTPIDEAWLRSVGFVAHWNGTYVRSWRLERLVLSTEDGCRCFESWIRGDDESRASLVRVKTRGDVKRLCEALGVELKSEEPK